MYCAIYLVSRRIDVQLLYLSEQFHKVKVCTVCLPCVHVLFLMVINEWRY